MGQRRKSNTTSRLAAVFTVLMVAGTVAVIASASPAPKRSEVDAERRRTTEDLSRLARAIDDYREDTGFEPRGLEGRPVYGWLRGPGAEPAFHPRPEGEPGQLEWFLTKPFMAGSSSWQGPYLDRLPRDPWGRCYVVFFPRPLPGTDPEDDPRPRCMVVSAGPDGVLQSDLRELRPAGDDVALLID